MNTTFALSRERDGVRFRRPLGLRAILIVGVLWTISSIAHEPGNAYRTRINPAFSDADWIALNTALPGANGNVNAIGVGAEGNVYFAGEFTVFGAIAANHIVQWNGTNWLPLGAGVNGPIRTLMVRGSDVYVGGSFTEAGGINANGIAKWDGHSWSALGAGMALSNGVPEVRALTATESHLYAGGLFNSAGGNPANCIARWDGTSWSALGTGVDDVVDALASSGENLFVGGHFTVADGQHANCIAKWDGHTWSVLGTGVSGIDPIGNPYVPFVSALLVSDGFVYAGGHFTNAGGVTANCIAKWDGTAWHPIGTGEFYGYYDSTCIRALAKLGTNLFAGGAFYTDDVGSGINGHIARWDGSAWKSLGYGANMFVYALSVLGDELYVGGQFTEVVQPQGPLASLPLKHVAKWSDNAWSAVAPGIDGPIYAFAVSGSTVYAGGAFRLSGIESSVRNIARWDGASWSGLQTGVNGPVHALAVNETKLYVAGSFNEAGGIEVQNVAVWNGSNWAGLGNGIEGPIVCALAINGNDLFAAGRFRIAGGTGATNIAKWNGSSWSALGVGVNPVSTIHALARSGNDLFVGGDFVTAGGLNARRIAKWDGAAWYALGSGLDGPVYAIAVDRTRIYVGGGFSQAGSLPAKGIAEWDGNSWSALAGGLGGQVDAIVVSGTNLYAGGSFTIKSTSTSMNAAWFDGSSWSPLGAGTDGDVLSLAANESGHLFIGGSFLTAGTLISPYVAQFDAVDGLPLEIEALESQTVEAGSRFELQPRLEGGPVVACEWYLDGTNRIACGVAPGLELAPVNFDNAGIYTLVVRNLCGSKTNPPVLLSVIPPVERRSVPAISVSGTIGTVVGIDCCESLGAPENWQNMETLTLQLPLTFCVDQRDPGSVQAYYRGWTAGLSDDSLALDLHFIPAISLTGTIGSRVRLEFIKAVGPTDAWEPLTSLTITNYPQMYFDTSSIDQPPRLYRIVPVVAPE